MADYVARTADLVVEELDDGLVVYDRRSDQAHWLDACTASVWRACRQSSGRPAIAQIAGVDAASCQGALDQLVAIGLVETGRSAGLSRRAALVGAAKIGVAGSVAAPIITAVIPAAAAAASTPGTTGNPPPPCTEPCSTAPQTFASGTATAPTTVSSTADAYTGPALTDGYPYPGLIPGTTYIGPPDADGAPTGNYTYTLQTPIIVPCSATAANLNVQFYSDNQGTVYVNGTAYAQNYPCGSAGEYADFGGGGAPPQSVDIPLASGSSNMLSFNVNNCAPSPTALDYLATLTLTC